MIDWDFKKLVFFRNSETPLSFVEMAEKAIQKLSL